MFVSLFRKRSQMESNFCTRFVTTALTSGSMSSSSLGCSFVLPFALKTRLGVPELLEAEAEPAVEMRSAATGARDVVSVSLAFSYKK